ncbi:RND transporter [Azoarcus indigens]|uniref:Cu/Ag efflux protein CusF n=1 Tax=Azoarcus indigens TaxID=29545 RepID=A0A4R6E810_9RHOO|nr:copper-binding protein [Azoarcus indigens]NMG65417.1 RND transporter [Azoarcus indigens]TDN53389.1 Cu/Ag efflux protein CusF [Azoarcus indigens]
MARTASLAALATLALLAFPALAQHDDHGGHGAMHDHGAAQPPAAAGEAGEPLSEGTVRRIDKSAGKITIAHGPLANLGMPAMTMVFTAADPALLERAAVGARVKFRADRVDGAFIVTEIQPAE